MSLRHPKVLWFQSPPSPLPILSVTKAKYYVNLNICLNALISFALIRGYTHPPYLSIDTANSFTISHLDNCSRFWVQYSICSMIHEYCRQNETIDTSKNHCQLIYCFWLIYKSGTRKYSVSIQYLQYVLSS